jgi:hypothetical protein
MKGSLICPLPFFEFSSTHLIHRTPILPRERENVAIRVEHFWPGLYLLPHRLRLFH